jgi:cell division septation protein DedD
VIGCCIHTLVTIAPLDRARVEGRLVGRMTKLIEPLRSFGLAMIAACGMSVSVSAQTLPQAPAPPPAAATDQPASNPVCVRFEAQLAALNRGAADPARTDQIRRYEDAIAKQQGELDRVLAQSKRLGCEGGGFFALFTGQSPQCAPVTTHIQQMRDNLDRMMSDLEHLKSGNNADQESQRRALIGQLAQNNCGPQYRAAAAAAGPGGFLDALFSGALISPGGDGAPAGTYRTVCVRTCDGYYFPISYSTVQNRFADDQRACQRMCPAAEVALYSYRNPGEDINQAVSLNGQQYTELPNAFHYRKEVVAACSCRRQGQSWADALKNADDSSTLESGDIIVTDQNAKTLSQAPQPQQKGKQGPKGAAAQPDASAAPVQPAPAPAAADANASGTNGVRVVGPPFVAGR